MDAVAITIGISWTLAGLVCVGLAIPLILGLVGKNSLYGFRFPQSFQSDDAWFAINRFGGSRLIIWSIPLMFIGIGAFFLQLKSQPELALVLGFAPLIFIMIPAIEAWRFACRYYPVIKR